MKKNANWWHVILFAVVFLFTACQNGASDLSLNEENSQTNEKLTVVTTLFPYYDFVRQIGGPDVDVTMVVPAGMDSHSFEPTPAHIKAISQADILVRNGGELEHWMGEVLKSIDTSRMTVVTMMDYVDVVEQENQEDHDGHDHSPLEEEGFLYDEHIWTSPVNAGKVVAELNRVFQQADPSHSEGYEMRTDAYVKQLQKLDQDFEGVMDRKVRSVIVVADQFPFRYLARDYGLDYRAAFAGCSSHTEPSARTIASLVDEINRDHIPVVYYLELSSKRTAELISEETQAVPLLLHSCHNVTRGEFDAGITYLKLMEQNVENLRKGLEL